MTADKPQPATTGRTLLRSTHRATARRFVVTNKRKHKLTKHMIIPTAWCHSQLTAKNHSVASSPSQTGRSEDRFPMGESFLSLPDRPWDPPSLLYERLRVFPVGKAAGAWRFPSNPSSVEVKEGVEL